jgi:lipopolysaccharide/colanic/teichoic acid biosynthesis glycosyltransferase
MSTDQVSATPRRIGRSARAGARHRPKYASAGSRHTAGRVNRLLDVAIASAMLGLLAIPMLAIALLIRVTSRGGAIYRQERTGLGGKTFVMYKFRTMRRDAEANSGPVWARRNDPRRTRLGILLRRLCMDELPQLLNVLKGDMSLVGPRPERPYFVQQFSRRFGAYNQRHQVRPGITGWAQVNGWRGDSSVEKRLEYDLFYVNNPSVRLNLRIMVVTPLRVLVDRDAC